ncbi:MAG: hypothetical protein NC300_05140 [Bacteroidales bacterium]|nr:hypothetical protein [Clostridium sp.]MCM1203508.1 hypothetical protein [Bacteroidales bacterium]
MDSEWINLLSQMADAKITDSDFSKIGNKFNEPECTRMPAYLKEQIITRTAQPDMQTAAMPKRFSKRMELFLYSCKVTAAVAACLLLMITFSVTQSRLSALPEEKKTQAASEYPAESILGTITDYLTDKSRYITVQLQNFSHDIMKKEHKTKQKH